MPYALRSSIAQMFARFAVLATTTPLRTSLNFAPSAVAEASARTW